MRREVQNFRAEVHADISMVRTLAQGHSLDMERKDRVARVEAKADKLTRLEERVGALEDRRTG